MATDVHGNLRAWQPVCMNLSIVTSGCFLPLQVSTPKHFPAHGCHCRVLHAKSWSLVARDHEIVRVHSGVVRVATY